MIYLELFFAFFKIGLFGFGGGYAMLSFIQNQVVEQYGWITQGEFADIVAISQMTPGPISINSATYIGYTVSASALGSTMATLGLCMPSIILMLVAAYIFSQIKNSPIIRSVIRAMRPVVIALILAAAFLLYNDENFIDLWSYVIFAGSLTLVFFKVNPIYVIIICGVAGFLIY